MKNYGTDPELDKLVNSENYEDRIEAAEQGYALDRLLFDEDIDVFEAVLDYLSTNNYRSIFNWAKDNNIDLDIEEWFNSDNWFKLNEVAKYGYKLDKLIYYKDYTVHMTVINYLKDYNYKSIFDWAKDNNINMNIDIDELLSSEDWRKREQAAMYGYGLDTLINDENKWVRVAIAEQGYGLDELINDENMWVRKAVAKQGYGLDKLVYDKDELVRITVAEQGYGLDKLVYDTDECVRVAVARQGYRLDKLVNDEDEFVRNTVQDYLEEHNLTIEEWCEQNGKEMLKVNTELKDFVYKVEDSSKIKIETSYDSVDEFFKDTSDNSYEDKESIILVAIDTKVPLIKLEKTKNKDKKAFKFIVDISNDEDNFSVKSIFDTKEKFDQLLQSTINSLREYPQFNKYADELENCI